MAQQLAPRISNSTSDNPQIRKTFQLLNDGDERIELYDRHKNVTLILGNTGSGKTTFIQWIAGDNDKLIAKEVAQGEYIIEDGNRIGTATIKSKTIFPELVLDQNTGAAYYDCPGFSDTRSTSNDIATSYFIKKVADHAENLRMVFVVSYPSVRKGVDRLDFMKLLRHSTDFIRDVDKFKTSIAMVVSKVENRNVKIGKNYSLVSDENVIVGIAGFLQDVRQGLAERLVIRSDN